MDVIHWTDVRSPSANYPAYTITKWWFLRGGPEMVDELCAKITLISDVLFFSGLVK